MSRRQGGNVAPMHPAGKRDQSAGRGRAQASRKGGNALEQRDVEHVPQCVADVTRLGRRRALLQVWRRRAKTISDYQKAGTAAKEFTVELAVGFLDRQRRQQVVNGVLVFLQRGGQLPFQEQL